MNRRHFLLGGLLASAVPLANPLAAAPQRYRIGPGGAEITYTFTLNANAVTGTVPLSSADLRIDPTNLAASTADVRADIRQARTGLIFATEALKSASVLDAQRFPDARFRSTRVILGPGGRISDGAALEGDLTLRGVTRPVRLTAELLRPAGSAPDDLTRLRVTLRGALNRSDYGATGFANLVQDRVGLFIRADIVAA